MKLQFRKTFTRDLRKLKDKTALKRVQNIVVSLENAQSLNEVANLRSIKGHSGYFRIRMGDYRLGIFFDGETVELVRCLHRRDIYRYFP